FEDKGYRVDIARDGVEALENIIQKAYDLIITDNMPQMTGEEFYREVLSLNRDLAKKIIFTSANITEFIKSTGNPLLEKPFFKEELIKTVEGLSTCS
ncbi:MAG TPA: response regulator, partial [Thermodesulfobacteriota bacterium]|nr:response regulator [Thermodesulfobacteriota bacterium]